jgi:nitrate/TMAO reductase-like tetraheme cytochrome c subunit
MLVVRGVATTLLGLALAGGCEGTPANEHGDPPPDLAAVSEPARPEPAPLPGEAECRECHAEVAEQWARSRHHLSFTNADFARSHAREPRPFCRDCHAPARARPASLPRLDDAGAEQLGVGCIDCHVDPDRPHAVLTGPDPDTTAPHELLPAADFGTRSCARCHEFDFSPTSRRPRGTMMQTTMREHASSAHAEQSCADCHLPTRSSDTLGGRDHSLASTRDPAAWRAALEVEARRERDTLILALRPVGVGHALPTGDLFRRLEVHAQLRRGEQILAERTRYLDREFEAWRKLDGRRNPAYERPVVDDRLTGPTTIELALEHDGSEGAVLEWWVDYERVDARSHLQPARSTLASEIRLAQGVL